MEEHRRLWKKVIEMKSSEPQGLHHGHYKAGMESDCICGVDVAFREIPYKTGYAPVLWRELTDCSIEKKPGNVKVEEMRTIELMNSELNANSRKLGLETRWAAESARALP